MDKSIRPTGFSLGITKLKDRTAAQKQLKIWYPGLKSLEIDQILKEVDFPLVEDNVVNDQYQNLLHKTASIRECGMNTVREKYPPGGGEIVGRQYYTFLKDDYNNIPKGTVALVRSLTSMDTVIFMHFGTVANNNVELYENTNEPEELPPPFQAIASAIVSQIALSIIGAITGKIVGKLMDEAINKVFPPSPPDYLKEVYEEMRNIVREELDAQVLDTTTGKLNQVISSLRNNYVVRKKHIKIDTDAARQELFNELKGYDRILREDIRSTLETDRYKVPGIAIWMEAVNIHYLIYMEMALLDSFSNDQQESSYYESIKAYLKDDLDFLSKTHKAIDDMRNSLFEYGEFFVFEMKYQGKVYYFKDNYRGEQREYRDDRGCKNPGWERRDKIMKLYKHNDFDLIIKQDLQPMVDQIAHWKKLSSTLETSYRSIFQ